MSSLPLGLSKCFRAQPTPVAGCKPTCKLLRVMRCGSVKNGPGGSPGGLKGSPGGLGGSPGGLGTSGGVLLGYKEGPGGDSTAKLTDRGTSRGVAWKGEVTCPSHDRDELMHWDVRRL